MQFCTAYGALVPFGKVSRGDFVIVTAASSSVGLAAIQIVKAEGGTSIAATRTAAKKDRLLALGAAHVIVTDEENLVTRVEEITGGKGARIVFDPIGGDLVNALAQATASGGSIFIYGMLSGRPTPFPMSAFGRRIAMYGYTFNELRDTPEWDVMKRYIYDHLVDGSFTPEIARISRLPRQSRRTGISRATSRSAKWSSPCEPLRGRFPSWASPVQVFCRDKFMKVYRYTNASGASAITLGEAAMPEPGPGEVRVP